MAKATIKSKTGAFITIEGTDAEVSRVIVAFEETARPSEPVAFAQVKEIAAKTRVAKKEAKMRLSASDLVIRLKEEGFFEQPKTLGEISTALQEEGFLYPVTSLSGVLQNLAQKRLLRRKKAEGKRYVYGK